MRGWCDHDFVDQAANRRHGFEARIGIGGERFAQLLDIAAIIPSEIGVERDHRKRVELGELALQSFPFIFGRGEQRSDFLELMTARSKGGDDAIDLGPGFRQAALKPPSRRALGSGASRIFLMIFADEYPHELRIEQVLAQPSEHARFERGGGDDAMVLAGLGIPAA